MRKRNKQNIEGVAGKHAMSESEERSATRENVRLPTLRDVVGDGGLSNVVHADEHELDPMHFARAV